MTLPRFSILRATRVTLIIFFALQFFSFIATASAYLKMPERADGPITPHP